MGAFSTIRRAALGFGVAFAALPALAGQGLVMFPADQFGHARLVLPQSTLHLENVLGRNPNFERLSSYNPKDPVRIMSNPVGRLDLLVERNGREGVVTCTASIISDLYVLTNNHCSPDGEKDMKFKRAMLLMNYYSEDKDDQVDRYKIDLNPVEHSGKLDYAIFRVEGDPAKKYGEITINPRDPWPGESLLIVHHPAGLPKHLTRGGCRAVAPHAVRGTDILHRCDTLPGSSGSPIFAFGTGAVIGLHYAGSASATPGSYNFGKRLSQIAKASKIIAEVVHEAEERERKKDHMSVAQRERERQALKTKLRAEMEAELKNRLSASRGAMRDKLEAELRAKLEKQLRAKMAKMQVASLGAAAAAGAAARPKPIDMSKLAPAVRGNVYKMQRISVPLPRGSWHEIFAFNGKHHRPKDVMHEHRGLIAVANRQIQRVAVFVSNLDGDEYKWRNKRNSLCRPTRQKGDYFFFVNNGQWADPVVCWRFSRFHWLQYRGDIKGGAMEKIARASGRMAYSLTEHGAIDDYYGFHIVVASGGKYVRALYAFRSSVFGFEKKLCCGNREKMKPVVAAAAQKLVRQLLRGLENKKMDTRAVDSALTSVE